MRLTISRLRPIRIKIFGLNTNWANPEIPQPQNKAKRRPRICNVESFIDLLLPFHYGFGTSRDVGLNSTAIHRWRQYYQGWNDFLNCWRCGCRWGWIKQKNSLAWEGARLERGVMDESITHQNFSRIKLELVWDILSMTGVLSLNAIRRGKGEQQYKCPVVTPKFTCQTYLHRTCSINSPRCSRSPRLGFLCPDATGTSQLTILYSD